MPPIAQKCALCLRFLNKIRGVRKHIQTPEECDFYNNSNTNGVRLVPGNIICSVCRRKPYPKKTTRESRACSSSSDSNQLSNDCDQDFIPKVNNSTAAATTTDGYLEITLPRTVSTHAYCCVCNKKSKLTIVPEKARIQSYLNRGIYIPVGNRCCNDHVINNMFYTSELKKIAVFSNTTFITRTELEKLLNTCITENQTPLYKKIDGLSYDETKIHILTGLTLENIQELSEILPMHDNSGRSVVQAIIIFLVKLRTGSSNKLVSTILQLEREQAVSDYSNSVIKSFEKNVLPHHFGIKNNIRQDLIDQHTTEIAKILYNAHDKLILICDGTYARHQKSANNEYQRKSYSGQKKVPLCKPFTICTTDGYIVDMLGPYEAHMNDAAIMRHILDDPNGLCQLMQPGDIFILDRGFRDVVDMIKAKGYQVMMPALKGKQKQLTTEQANHSRFVTKTRWVVESVHGMLKKKFRLLDYILDNKMLPKIGSYYRISSYILNRYVAKQASDTTIRDPLIERMLALKNETNTLAAEIEEKGWLRKRLPFEPISSTDVLDFGVMTETDLKIFFTGTYQYSQAVSYLAEMLSDEGILNMHVVKDLSHIIKVQVQSRHINRKCYRCFIDYLPNGSGVSAIRRHYCECANGLRTVGCCAHLAAVIYYLAYGRYLSKILRPAQVLSYLFTNKDFVTVIEEDSDMD